jgi:circadian clock protein KaiB
MPLMEKYVIKLYVTESSPYSREAIANIQLICKEYLQNGCDLQIIDVESNPDLAEEDGILAIPTLIKVSPAPERRLIGALSQKTRVMTGLDLL